MSEKDPYTDKRKSQSKENRNPASPNQMDEPAEDKQDYDQEME
jgi:hypothetical protein